VCSIFVGDAVGRQHSVFRNGPPIVGGPFSVASGLDPIRLSSANSLAYPAWDFNVLWKQVHGFE